MNAALIQALVKVLELLGSSLLSLLLCHLFFLLSLLLEQLKLS
jgi:hypothetical protein